MLKFREEVGQYDQVDIKAIKSMISAMEQKSIQGFNLRPDLLEISDILTGIGSDDFAKIYADVLANMLKEIPSDYFAGNDFFDLNGSPNIATTSIPKANLNEDLDQSINTIRGLLIAAFPDKGAKVNELIQISDNVEFLDKLYKAAESGVFGSNMDSLKGHIKGLKEKYPGLSSGKASGKAIRQYNTNLQNVTGQILWENISLIARERALRLYFNSCEPEITKAFRSTGGYVTVTGHQSGHERSSEKKQEVSDSFVTISFHSFDGGVIAEAIVGDSTKLSQNALKNNSFFIGSTKTQSESFTVGHLLNKVNQRVYWERRLQVYLRSRENRIDDKNWDNTRQGFYLLALYDVLAIRATTSGKYAQTLTINNKIRLISDIIGSVSNYYEKTERGAASHGIRSNNIFELGRPKYASYVARQQKKSSGHTSADEQDLQSYYDKYISTVMSAKISIGTNVLL